MKKLQLLISQVEDLNKSQMSINKILAGVKKFGTLAEFSLGSLLQDLLPASQYNSNVKTKDDSGENVEFAIKTSRWCYGSSRQSFSSRKI